MRRFEEKVEERFRAGDLAGFLHVAIGQEAVAVGVCGALEEGDVIASTHRAHAHALAKGTHPERADGGALRQGRRVQPRLRRLHAPLRRRARATSARTPSSAAACRRSPAPRCPSSCAASRASRSRSSATARRTSAPSTSRSTSPSSGGCPPSSSARTTATRSRPRPGSSCRSRISPSARSPSGCTRSSSTARTSRRSTRRRRRAVEHARDGQGACVPAREHVRLTGHYVGDPQVYRPREEVRELRQTQDPIEKLRAKLDVARRGVGRARARGRRARGGLGRVRAERHRPAPRRRAQERLRLTARAGTDLPGGRAGRDGAGDARATRTSSSWARTSPRWAAPWA